jgi:hypothetical protein
MVSTSWTLSLLLLFFHLQFLQPTLNQKYQKKKKKKKQTSGSEKGTQSSKTARGRRDLRRSTQDQGLEFQSSLYQPLWG